MSSFTIDRKSFGLWFGGIFLLLGVGLLVAGIFRFYDDWRFSQQALSTQGTVLTKQISQSRSTRDSDGVISRTTHYEVTYRFTVEGATLEGHDELPHAEWDRLKEGGPVDVLYRPQQPSSNRPAGSRPWVLNTLFVLIGSLFTGIGGTIVVRAVRHARLEDRLRQDGVRTQGTVTELRMRNLSINNIQQCRLHVEYRDFQGHRHVTTIDMGEDEAQQWKVGDVGSVLYDAARPTEVVWLGRNDGAG